MSQPPFNYSDLVREIDKLRDLRRTLLCRPEHVEMFRNAVKDLGLEALVTVAASELVSVDTAVLIHSDVLRIKENKP